MIKNPLWSPPRTARGDRGSRDTRPRERNRTLESSPYSPFGRNVLARDGCRPRHRRAIASSSPRRVRRRRQLLQQRDEAKCCAGSCGARTAGHRDPCDVGIPESVDELFAEFANLRPSRHRRQQRCLRRAEADGLDDVEALRGVSRPTRFALTCSRSVPAVMPWAAARRASSSARPRDPATASSALRRRRSNRCPRTVAQELGPRGAA